jgi:hypothetical protein
MLKWTLGFILVGMAWGLTTPFIRKAAIDFNPPPRSSIDAPENSWVKKRVLRLAYTIIDLLRNPRYAIPLLLNFTGGIWFFLLVGQAGRFIR